MVFSVRGKDKGGHRNVAIRPPVRRGIFTMDGAVLINKHHYFMKQVCPLLAFAIGFLPRGHRPCSGGRAVRSLAGCFWISISCSIMTLAGEQS